MIGIALFLTHMAKSGLTCAALRKTYPDYFMSKNKIDLPKGTDVPSILAKVKEQYAAFPVNTEDGVKIEFEKSWVHLRASNTEPIIRVYSEAPSVPEAEQVAKEVMKKIEELM